MIFDENVTLSDFIEIYGGNDQGGIVIPRDYPYIYIVFQNEGARNHNNDNLDWNGNGTHDVVHYTHEADNKKNDAVINHKRRRCYNSIFVFARQVDDLLNVLGEYEFIENRVGDDGSSYFVLNKLDRPISDAEIYFSEKDGELSRVGDSRIFFERLRGIVREEVENEQILYNDANEGQYYYRVDDRFENVVNNLDSNEYKRAMQREYSIRKLNEKIRRLASRYIMPEGVNCEVENAFLYCINVGCGNMLLMVLQNGDEHKIFCFDFGIENVFGAGGGVYREHIEDCLEHIRNIFGIEEIIFDKLFITHPHYDHISESNPNFLSRETEVYMGFYNNFSSDKYFSLIADTAYKCCNYVSLICDSSDEMVNILHPEQKIGYKAHRGYVPYLAGKLNNVSPIICICLVDNNENNYKVVFTGDIERQGWQWYINCPGTEKLDVDVYIHSHHGSENGHSFTDLTGRNHVCYDYFESRTEFVSTRDGCRFGGGTLNVATGISHDAYRTDVPDGISFYEYDIFRRMRNHYYVRR